MAEIKNYGELREVFTWRTDSLTTKQKIHKHNIQKKKKGKPRDKIAQCIPLPKKINVKKQNYKTIIIIIIISFMQGIYTYFPETNYVPRE